MRQLFIHIRLKKVKSNNIRCLWSCETMRLLHAAGKCTNGYNYFGEEGEIDNNDKDEHTKELHSKLFLRKVPIHVHMETFFKE